jgi:UDP-glucose 4-epimerase
MSEIILEDLATHKGFNAMFLRYFNPIWAHPSGLIGENPKGTPNNLLPYIYKVASGEYEYLNVRGDDYPTPDGTCIRDYLHVMDLAEAHVAAYEYLQKNAQAEWFLDVFNLWTGQGTSVLEIIQLTEKAIDKKISYKIWLKRAGDASTVYANPSKANSLLGRTTKKTISEAIQDGWRFINNH